MTCYSIGTGSPQTTQNSLVSGNGGELLAENMYTITSPLVITASVEENIRGQGKATGFKYTGSATNNVLQIGSGSYQGTKLLLEKYQIQSTSAHMTGIFVNQCNTMVLEHLWIYNVESGMWIVKSYGQRLNDVQFQSISGDAIGFDSNTPANNVTLFETNGFGVTGAIVAMYNECNGLYIHNGDYETFGSLLRLGASSGCSYRDIDIAFNDFETMSGSFIINPSNLPIYEFSLRHCTFGGCANVVLSHITDGEIDKCSFWNTNIIIDQTNNTNFSIGNIKLMGTSTLTII